MTNQRARNLAFGDFSDLAGNSLSSTVSLPAPRAIRSASCRAGEGKSICAINEGPGRRAEGLAQEPAVLKAIFHEVALSVSMPILTANQHQFAPDVSLIKGNGEHRSVPGRV